MVDIKVAVDKAIEFAKTTLGAERAENIRLEEIDSSTQNGHQVWLVTLSNAMTLEEPLNSMRAAMAVLGANSSREYRIFTVSKENGEVFSMKIRLLVAPTK